MKRATQFGYTRPTLKHCPNLFLQAAAAWALGQVGRHTPVHAKKVSEGEAVFPTLLALSTSSTVSEDLKTKVGMRMLLAGPHTQRRPLVP